MKASDIEGPATTEDYVGGTHKESLKSQTDEVKTALEKTKDAVGTQEDQQDSLNQRFWD